MEDLYDTIENYLQGQLPEEEERAFAERLRQEPELAMEVQAFQLAQDIVEEGIADQLRTDFTTWNQEATAPTSAKVVSMRSMRKVLAIAAGVLLLISVAFFQYRSTQENYNSTVLAAHYHDADLGFTRSTTATENELSAATEALQADNYALAIQELQTIEPSSAYYTNARLLLADAYFLNDQLDLATATNSPLLAAEDPLLREKAAWLSILIDLKAGKKNDPEFQLMLKEISTDTAHSFQPKAAELMAQLDGFWVKWVE
jgi:hypothetical protein